MQHDRQLMMKFGEVNTENSKFMDYKPVWGVCLRANSKRKEEHRFSAPDEAIRDTLHQDDLDYSMADLGIRQGDEVTLLPQHIPTRWYEDQFLEREWVIRRPEVRDVDLTFDPFVCVSWRLGHQYVVEVSTFVDWFLF
jgi:hypothetical protein